MSADDVDAALSFDPFYGSQTPIYDQLIWERIVEEEEPMDDLSTRLTAAIDVWEKNGTSTSFCAYARKVLVRHAVSTFFDTDCRYCTDSGGWLPWPCPDVIDLAEVLGVAL